MDYDAALMMLRLRADRPILTVADVQARVALIDAVAADAETAHSEEDKLWGQVLAAIAAGCPEPHLLAAEALKTSTLDFPRWCA